MRKLLSVIVIVVLLGVIFNLAQASYESYKKLQEVTGNQGQEKELKLKNEQLKKELADKQTDFSLEKEARDKLDYGKAGETTIVVQNSNLDKSGTKPTEKEPTNLEKWLQFLKISF